MANNDASTLLSSIFDLDVSDVQWQIIFSYLDAKSLCAAAQSTKALRILGDQDGFWHSLCLNRWCVTDRMKRVMGCSDWKSVFRLMSKRRKVPNGVYTDRRHRHFGTGRASGVDAWLFLGDNRNARGRQQPGLNAGLMMELRVCVQNTSNSLFRFSPAALMVRARSETRGVLEELSVVQPRLVALNGHKVVEPSSSSAFSEGSDELHLAPFFFAVVALSVSCPGDVVFETDLLARLHSLSVRGLRRRPAVRLVDAVRGHGKASSAFPVSGAMRTTQPEVERLEVTVLVHDEHKFMEQFVELPGGVVLRKDWGNVTEM